MFDITIMISIFEYVFCSTFLHFWQFYPPFSCLASLCHIHKLLPLDNLQPFCRFYLLFTAFVPSLLCCAVLRTVRLSRASSSPGICLQCVTCMCLPLAGMCTIRLLSIQAPQYFNSFTMNGFAIDVSSRICPNYDQRRF